MLGDDDVVVWRGLVARYSIVKKIMSPRDRIRRARYCELTKYLEAQLERK